MNLKRPYLERPAAADAAGEALSIIVPGEPVRARLTPGHALPHMLTHSLTQPLPFITYPNNHNPPPYFYGSLLTVSCKAERNVKIGIRIAGFFKFCPRFAMVFYGTEFENNVL